MENNSQPKMEKKNSQPNFVSFFPPSQHLMVDIEGVEGDFLNSEDRLAKAMIETIEAAGFQMLSYHCHKLNPKGVSCVGVLLDSHISFHTWPDEGVITLDLFVATGGSLQLVPLVSTMKSLFGIIPSTPDCAIDDGACKNDEEDDDEIGVRWSHELRGFYRGIGNGDDDDETVEANRYFASLDHHSDLNYLIHSPSDFLVKEQVVSTSTKYHRVDIWDSAYLEDQPTYAMERQLKQDTVKTSHVDSAPRDAEKSYPFRSVFVDGVLRTSGSPIATVEDGSGGSTSTLKNLALFDEYAEALVHPAMFSHPHPKKIAIGKSSTMIPFWHVSYLKNDFAHFLFVLGPFVFAVGGAEGSTLSEVLKHKTVESVTMIEEDEEMVGIMRAHLPYNFDCADLIGRAAVCYEDDVVDDMVARNPKEWFIEQRASSATDESDLFDVVVVDTLEPKLLADGSTASSFLVDKEALSAMVQSLTDDGIMAVNIGAAPMILDPKPDVGTYAPREALIRNLESLDDVAAVIVFEEPSTGATQPGSMLIVCRSVNCRQHFYATSDVIDYQIYDRLVHRHSKARSLENYDGIVHLSYQVPPKAWETVYCRREPTPFECAYRHLDFGRQIFDYDFDDESGPFRVVAEYDGDNKEWANQTRVVANMNIPRGSYIMPTHLAKSATLSEKSLDRLRTDTQPLEGGTAIRDFLEFVDAFSYSSLSPGLSQRLLEVGASMYIRMTTTEEDINVGRWMPPHPSGTRPKFSPVYDRHGSTYDVLLVATKDISKGQELLRAEIAVNV